MDMWTMRLRRTGRSRGQRHALPTAAPFAHMPTAFYWQESNEESDNIALVTFLCEATRAARIVDAGQYHIRVDVSTDTAFAGCWAWWTRQVTPAPASASFTDVPTDHWAFRWIEALKAAGVTSGCTATTYCPNNSVTRAEVAVFLSKALGLSWPN
jgi:hypothetical protein